MFISRLKQGIAGGLAGGLVFGIMMAMMGTLPMIGNMVGLPNAVAGFVVHLVISAAIGAGFGAVAGPFVKNVPGGLGLGLLYGSAWWILGPLTLMPLMMGMGLGVNWTTAAAQAMLPSLMGHAVFGLVLGFAYSRGDRCLLTRLIGGSRDSGAGTGKKSAARAV